MSDSADVDHMRRRKFLVEGGRAVLSFSLLPLVARAQGNQKPPEFKGDASSAVLIAELERQIPPRMEEAKVPGLSIAIIKDGKLFWRGAFGVKDRGESVDNDTLFEAASVSKTMFAYAVMKLCEKGS